MRIIITGGLGFVGSHIAEFLLKKNHEILIITKTFSKKQNIRQIKDKIRIEKVDVSNFKKLGKVIEEFKPQTIIHLAGNTSHYKSFEEPFKDLDSNTKSTLFILEKIKIYNNGKFFRDFIFISDVVTAVYTIMKKGKSGELYWISSGKKIWFKNFANILKKYTNCGVAYPTTPGYTKKVDVGNFVVDNSKLKSLGWSPKTDVQLGIKETMKYFEIENL